MIALRVGLRRGPTVVPSPRESNDDNATRSTGPLRHGGGGYGGLPDRARRGDRGPHSGEGCRRLARLGRGGRIGVTGCPEFGPLEPDEWREAPRRIRGDLRRETAGQALCRNFIGHDGPAHRTRRAGNRPGRRSHHATLHVRGHIQRDHGELCPARVRRHRRPDLSDRPGKNRRRRHVADAGDPSGAHRRLPGRPGSDSEDRPDAQTPRNRRRLPSPSRRVTGNTGRGDRPRGLLQLPGQ